MYESHGIVIDSLRANLCGALLQGYDGVGSNTDWEARPSLAGAILTRADLSGANLFLDDLRYAELDSADLSHANLNGANLDSANLSNANLRHARLVGTRLEGASLGSADLSDALFEIQPEALPDLRAFRRARNLKKLGYSAFPDALYELRRRMIEAGRDDIARELTRAIEHSTTRKRWNESAFGRAIARKVFWEWTTDYGLRPMRALLLLVGLIPCFALVYAIAIWRPPTGLFRVLPADRLESDGKESTFPVQAEGLQVLGPALRFSLFSAFAVGFRGVDVGSWLARLQGTEEMLRARGWVRSVSGFQSLVSLILLAAFLIAVLE